MRSCVLSRAPRKARARTRRSCSRNRIAAQVARQRERSAEVRTRLRVRVRPAQVQSVAPRRLLLVVRFDSPLADRAHHSRYASESRDLAAKRWLYRGPRAGIFKRRPDRARPKRISCDARAVAVLVDGRTVTVLAADPRLDAPRLVAVEFRDPLRERRHHLCVPL